MLYIISDDSDDTDKLSHKNFDYNKFYANKSIFSDKKSQKTLRSLGLKRKIVEKNLVKSKKAKPRSARRLEFSAYNSLVKKVYPIEAKTYSKVLKKKIKRSSNKEKAKVYLNNAKEYQSKLKKLVRKKKKLDKKRRTKNSDENFEVTKEIVGLSELMIMELRKSLIVCADMEFKSFRKKKKVKEEQKEEKKKEEPKKEEPKKEEPKKEEQQTQPQSSKDNEEIKRQLANLQSTISKLESENETLKQDLSRIKTNSNNGSNSSAESQLRLQKQSYEAVINNLKSQLNNNGAKPAANTDADKEIFYFNGVSGKNLYKDQFIPNLKEELPRGIAFKIQVAVYNYKIDKNKFSDWGKVSVMYDQGNYKYLVGLFRTYQVAEIAKNYLREQGYRDAFVVAFYNGEMVSYEKAVQNLSKYSNDVESDYYKAFERESNYLVKALSTFEKNRRKARGVSKRRGSVKVIGRIESQKGIFFSVQLGAFRANVNTSKFSGIGSIYKSSESGLTKYFSGKFKKYSDAVSHSKTVKRKFPQAFIVAYRNGVRIPIDEARILNNN